MAQYKRVLLKLSGESLMGKKQYGIDETRLAEYAEQYKFAADNISVHRLGFSFSQSQYCKRFRHLFFYWFYNFVLYSSHPFSHPTNLDLAPRHS